MSTEKGLDVTNCLGGGGGGLYSFVLYIGDQYSKLYLGSGRGGFLYLGGGVGEKGLEMVVKWSSAKSAGTTSKSSTKKGLNVTDFSYESCHVHLSFHA